MTEVSDRLARCFSSVLPNMTKEEICEANVAALADVDSWAAVTLIAVIDEEFGVAMSPDQLWELGSFQAIEQYLSRQDRPGEQDLTSNT